MDNASQVNFSCNSIRSASHHNVLLLPYAPNIFDSLPPPQPRSIPCSHHSTRLSTACPTSWASGSSHRSCSCTAEVPAGHLARQADRLGGHCLSVAGGPSRIDEDSALPILPLVRAPVGPLSSIHPPQVMRLKLAKRFLQGGINHLHSFP